MFIPCQYCKQTYPKDWLWYTCENCGYSVCLTCLGKIGLNVKNVLLAILKIKRLRPFTKEGR
jgi:hypothetical protein